MKILFIGDVAHPNAQSWIQGLKDTIPCAVCTWSLPSTPGSTGRLRRVLAWLRAALSIRQMVSRLSPDLLIAYRTTSYGFLGALSGFHPLVVAAQGETDAWPADSAFVGLKRWMARYCLRKADLVHAWGDHIAEEQLALGALPDKMLVRPRGVDVDRFFPAADGSPTDALCVVCTRGLYADYRHEVILEAIGLVAGQGIPVSLDIVGDGPLMSDLRERASRLGISSAVRFHGRVRHDKLPDLLRQCNVYVSMPVTEGVSASLLEAMACGCYPIVSDLVANRSWIARAENGMLVPVDDVPALQAALCTVWQDMTVIARAAVTNRALVCAKGSLKDNIWHFVRKYESLVAQADSRRH